jgi:hypothetical protein
MKNLLGGKGAHLAEMINGGFPVPEAYFITSEAYKEFIEINKLRPKIMQIINASDFSNIDSLRDASDKIKDIIIKSAQAAIAVGGSYGTLSEIAYSLPPGMPRILTFAAKWEPDSSYFQGTKQSAQLRLRLKSNNALLRQW